jgi:hypothetical protein
VKSTEIRHLFTSLLGVCEKGDVGRIDGENVLMASLPLKPTAAHPGATGGLFTA